VVAALGDLAYPDGATSSFRGCFDTAWGPVAERIRPTVGNHDVRTAGAAGYFAYFGAAAGLAPRGYYSYDLGSWHVVVLNSNCEAAGGCGPDSPQVRWLREDLAQADTDNVLAYWHHPRFSTGDHGDDDRTATFWEVLDGAGADVVLNGHEHDYQRFVALDPDGASTEDGIVQFVVGTGGVGLREFGPSRPTVAFRQNDLHGVLELTLHDCGYSFAFLGVDGRPPADSGSVDGTCGVPRGG
jgi:hypothetical protein